MGKYDRWLLFITVLLIGFGALMIYSTTSVVTPALAKRGVSEFYYFKRHIFTILIGFSFMFLAYRLKPSTIKKMAIPLLIFSFVLLILVFLPSIGVSAGGARRWIRLWPSTFQPSELVKLSMVIFLARYISMPEYRTDSFTFFIKPVFIMIIFQIAILKQPDFGAAMSLAFLTFAMLFLSGIRLRYLASLLVFAIPVIFKLITEP
ncbi:MAG: FtsW/RodA/SpoVE family cell cycle protein, partial [Nitrospirota bacterium]|nr:FtsW/RodA/SpoVE family cell cycle protein [Nitrospirota bacterium]